MRREDGHVLRRKDGRARRMIVLRQEDGRVIRMIE